MSDIGERIDLRALKSILASVPHGDAQPYAEWRTARGELWQLWLEPDGALGMARYADCADALPRTIWFKRDLDGAEQIAAQHDALVLEGEVRIERAERVPRVQIERGKRFELRTAPQVWQVMLDDADVAHGTLWRVLRALYGARPIALDLFATGRAARIYLQLNFNGDMPAWLTAIGGVRLPTDIEDALLEALRQRDGSPESDRAEAHGSDDDDKDNEGDLPF